MLVGRGSPSFFGRVVSPCEILQQGSAAPTSRDEMGAALTPWNNRLPRQFFPSVSEKRKKETGAAGAVGARGRPQGASGSFGGPHGRFNFYLKTVTQITDIFRRPCKSTFETVYRR